MANTIGTGDARDFDETRRLLYMALLVSRTDKYNLAGTLVNALVHHHAVDAITADEAMDHVVRGITGGDPVNDPEATEQSRAWLQAQIDRITAELGD